MAIGITQKAADEIWSKLRNLFSFTRLDIMSMDLCLDEIQQGVKGEKVVISLYHTATNALRSEVDHYGRELENKWKNKLDSLAGAYKSKDSELADALISKKS